MLILSIIIPIYNIEEYLARCLDSIFNQDIDETLFEVIAVNDGSTDRSSQILRKYINHHNNINLVEIDNSGVSVARNVGLDIAKGKYVTFVDSDDVLLKEGLRMAVDFLLCSESSDIIICNSYTGSTNNYPWVGFLKNNEKYSGTEVLNCGYLRGSICGCLINLSFLRNKKIKFIEGITNGEDTNFCMQIYFYSQKIKFENIDLYQVIGRENSASRVYTKARIDNMILSIDKIYRLSQLLEKEDGNQEVLNYMIYSPISNLTLDTVNTQGCGYIYLRKHHVNNYCNFHLQPKVIFLRRKMQLLKISFCLFFFLVWIKNSRN